ncbi:hypothetical protein [Variovorax saccharolyticus]|uniref:hypothetical protein n=1 Tax=Variovorax saccharolyticus TaxID=3053516 RepID=UPI002576B9DC|nr:hypothetical protein [Variovorax sp. J31P216]MDM0030460.1 hypothetical protein [Variovorax sp. J31P216]
MQELINNIAMRYGTRGAFIVFLVTVAIFFAAVFAGIEFYFYVYYRVLGANMTAWIKSLDAGVVDFWKAAATVLVALIAAGIAASIQYRQWRTARDKLKLDLFERRIKIYNAMQKVCDVRVAEANWEAINEFKAAWLEAKWIFGSDASNLLSDLNLHLIRLEFSKDVRIDLSAQLPVAEQLRVETERTSQEHMKVMEDVWAWRERNRGRADVVFGRYLRIGA